MSQCPGLKRSQKSCDALASNQPSADERLPCLKAAEAIINTQQHGTLSGHRHVKGPKITRPHFELPKDKDKDMITRPDWSQV